MAVSATLLTQLDSTGGGKTYSTPSYTPGADKVILVAVQGRGQGGNDPGAASLAGNGLTWDNILHEIRGGQRVSLFRGIGASPSTGALTVTWPGNCNGTAIHVVELDGVDTSGTNGSGAVVQAKGTNSGATTVGSIAFDSPVTPGNAVFGVFGPNENVDVTPGDGFAEVSEGGFDNPTTRTFTELTTSPADNVVDATWGTATQYAALAVELAADGGGVDVRNVAAATAATASSSGGSSTIRQADGLAAASASSVAIAAPIRPIAGASSALSGAEASSIAVRLSVASAQAVGSSSTTSERTALAVGETTATAASDAVSVAVREAAAGSTAVAGADATAVQVVGSDVEASTSAIASSEASAEAVRVAATESTAMAGAPAAVQAVRIVASDTAALAESAATSSAIRTAEAAAEAIAGASATATRPVSGEVAASSEAVAGADASVVGIHLAAPGTAAEASDDAVALVVRIAGGESTASTAAVAGMLTIRELAADVAAVASSSATVEAIIGPEPGPIPMFGPLRAEVARREKRYAGTARAVKPHATIERLLP